MNRDRVVRAGGAAVVSVLGLLLFAPDAARLVDGRGPAVELALAGLGALLGLALVAGGGFLFRQSFTPAHTLRVAGWALLGTAVLGAVVGLLVGAGVAVPPYAAATLLSVSTFAHVLIGVRDVQRIRAEELARNQEKLAVLNRLVRHDLRHEAQRLLFVESELPDASDAGVRERLAGDVGAVADDLSAMNDRLTLSQDLIRRTLSDATAVGLARVVDEAVAEQRAAHPSATIDVDVPAGCRVAGGDHVRQSVAELVENAVVHAGEAPHVTVAADAGGETVALTVTDDGPGIPESEREVIERETAISQLSHSQGIGLWFVRWVTDALGGEFDLEAEGEGTTVRLRLPRAHA
ncbi:MAG: sensor histidine kinase [Haloarculaceae archaeon]